VSRRSPLIIDSGGKVIEAGAPTRSPGARKRGRLGCGTTLLLTVVALFVVYAGLTPWALHIGGQSTPLREWNGYGQVVASNGGTYLLYTHLEAGVRGRPGHSPHTGPRDTLHGTGQLCTRSGATHTFKLTGSVHAWWSTDGGPTRVSLTGGAPTQLPEGWVVALHGIWKGPALELTSPDNSFTEVFTPRGEIRHATSTADAGTARVTLRFGSEAEFAAACRALQAG
jgi:hypothetical protein